MSNHKALLVIALSLFLLFPLAVEAQTKYLEQLQQAIQFLEAQEAQLSAPPEIWAVVYNITPGSKVYVRLSSIGSAPRDFYLSGKFPGGILRFTDVSWYEHPPSNTAYVLGTIPSVSGVQDHDALLVVKTQQGSASKPVSFTATKEVIPLPQNLISVARCSTAASINTCSVNPRDVINGNTLSGLHLEYFLGHADHDQYGLSQPLKNGWKVNCIRTTVAFGSATGPNHCGPNTIFFTVWWGTLLFGSVYYNVYVDIIGPMGVPF